MEISEFFIKGDMKGAIAFMREHEEFRDILPAYTAIFERQEYRRFEVSERLNGILREYQVYYRDTFYRGLPEAEAAEGLRAGLRELLALPEAEEGRARDSHAAASARIRRGFAGSEQAELARAQARALALLSADTREMEGKYGEQG